MRTHTLWKDGMARGKRGRKRAWREGTKEGREGTYWINDVVLVGCTSSGVKRAKLHVDAAMLARPAVARAQILICITHPAALSARRLMSHSLLPFSRLMFFCSFAQALFSLDPTNSALFYV